MKTFKKLAALVMCVVMAAGCLSGCGGLNDEETLISAVKSINSAKCYDMTGKMTGKMNMKMGDIKQDMDMNSEVKGTQFTDPLKAKVVTTTTTAGQTVATESYVQKENDDYVVYVKMDGEWTKMSLGDLETAMSASGLNYAQNQLGEDVSKYVKKDDSEIEGKKYLTYEYTVSGEEVKSMMGGATSSFGSLFGNSAEGEQMEKIINDMVKEVGDLKMTVLIDRDEQSIYRIEYSMAEMMDKMMKSLMKSIAELGEKEGGDSAGLNQLSEMTIDVPEMNMEITYSNIDSAADFEIPKEALEAKENDLSLDGGSSESEE